MTKIPEDQLGRLIDAVNRLTEALEPLGRLTEAIERLERERIAAQTSQNVSRPLPGTDDLADEATMAKRLSIPKRTLAQYRRDGRLPNCWVKNGRRILWRVAETLDAWKRGIA